jgi:hypothetical protein
MTDEQILNALKSCGDSIAICDDCPYEGRNHCSLLAKQDIIERFNALKAENAALRKGIEGEEAFPVNFGDRVYIINFHKPKEQWKVGCGIVKTISITQTPDRTQLVFRVKIRYRNGKEYVLGRNAFLSIESAEARLAELKGGDHE